MELSRTIAKEKRIGILVVDARQVYMEKILMQMGYVTDSWDLREGGLPPEGAGIWTAEVLLLPVPISKIKEQKILYQRLRQHKATMELCIGGVFPKELQEVLEQEQIPWLDVLEQKEVAAKNAIATAEGTIAELSKIMPVNIEGSHIIVMGFGNCARPIAEKLYCLGAKVSVVARSEKALSSAHYFGYMDYPMDAEIPFGDADGIINTIPAPVITRKEIDRLKEDAVIVDIASAPGGCDGAYCREKGVPYVLALGLPGIYAPKTSGEILLAAMPFGFTPAEHKWKS